MWPGGRARLGAVHGPSVFGVADLIAAVVEDHAQGGGVSLDGGKEGDCGGGVGTADAVAGFDLAQSGPGAVGEHDGGGEGEAFSGTRRGDHTFCGCLSLGVDDGEEVVEDWATSFEVAAAVDLQGVSLVVAGDVD